MATNCGNIGNPIYKLVLEFCNGNATKAANAVQNINKEVVSNERLDNICPPYFNEAAKDCVAKYIIPLATELSDEQLKNKLASISLPSEFWSSFDEQVKETVSIENEIQAIKDEVGNTQDVITSSQITTTTPLQQATDSIVSEEQENTLLKDYLDNVQNVLFGNQQNNTQDMQSAYLQKNNPEILFFNKVRAEFLKDCKLNSYELNELSIDFVTRLSNFLTMFLQSDDLFGVYSELMPNIFNRTFKEKFDEIKKQPSKKQSAQLVKLIGTDNLVSLIINTFLNDSSIKEDLQTKLNIFTNPNYLSFLMMMSNPILNDVCGLHFQTKIYQKQDEQKEDTTDIEPVHKADKFGQLDLFEIEDTDIEEEDGTEDDSKKDIVREDSLTTSYLKNMDFSLRQKLQTLQKRGEKSIYNQVRNYTYTEVAHALLPVIYHAKNSEHMRQLIQNSDLSFKDDLLLMLLDPDFSTQLFHSFKKNKNRFVRMYRKENKTILTSINESDADLELDNIYSKALNYNIHKENSLLKVVDQQVNKLEQTLYIVNEVGLANFASLLDSIVNPNNNDKLKEHLNKNVPVDETRLTSYRNSFLQKEQINSVINALNLLGFQNRLSAESLYNYLSTPLRVKDNNNQIVQIMPYKRYTSLVNILFNTLNLLQRDKAFLKDTQKKFESNIEKLSKLVSNIAGNNIVYYTNVGDDSYFSYSNTNYIGRLLDTINNSNDAEFRKFVEEQFKNVNFFKPVFEDGFADDSSWIRDLYSNSNSAMLRNIFRLTIFTKYEAKKYQQLTDFEYDLFALKSYYNNNSNFAEYCLPVLSNKSRTGTIRWKKVKDVDKLLNNLYLVFFQEANRMKDVVTRAKNRTSGDRFYKNYDVQIDDFNNIEVGKGGLRFMFMPMFNKYLKYVNNEKACEKNVICAYLHEMLYQDHKYYNAARTEELQNACKEEIKKFLVGEVNNFISNLEKDGYYNVVKKELDFQNDDEFKRFINQYIGNNFFANTQIYQLLTTDLIFYKNADDVVKRTAEFISDGYALDSTASYYDENGEVRQIKKDKTYIVVPDFKQGFRNIEALNEMFDLRMQSDINVVKNNSKLSDKEKEIAIKKIQDKVNRWKKLYDDIDTTDGQGFSSFNWHYNLMHATGRFTNVDATTYYNLKSLYDEFADLFNTDQIISKNDARYQQLYEKVIEFNKYNNISYEPEKPFVYSQIIDNGVKVPIQVKNSEYPLLDLQSMMEEAVRTDENGNYIGDNTLAKLAAFMHKNDIDVCVFDSNIKVGNMLPGNSVTDCTSIEGLTKIQQTNTFSVPLEDVMKQQEIPNHAEDIRTAMGVQLKNFTFAAMNPDSKIDFNGEKISVKELRDLFESTFAKRIKYSSEKLIKDLKLDSVSPSERNIALSKFILNELSKKGTLDFDTQFRFSINNYGNFNIPLADVISRKTIDEVFTSAVKCAALDIEFPGGQLVQVTDGFRFNSSNTTLERDSSLKIVYYDKNGKETYDMKKGVRVAYMEAEMPYFYKNMYEFDKDGYPIDDERAKKLVVYRIPTEGPCSVYPIKVTKWSNKINGGIIKLPSEIPGIGGMDFDIDKLFFIAPSLKFNKKTHKCEYVDDIYLKSHSNSSDDRDCNIILEILWAALTSKDNMSAMFIPSNFFDFSHNKNVQISFAMNNTESLSDEEKLDLYEQLYSSDDKKLESESNANDNRACCSYLFQRNAARVNSAGLQMLGIFANANSQHVYMQGENLRCISENIIENGIVNINGNTITYNDKFDPVFALDGFTKVYENITQGLTASADAVKNPTLDQLNINKFTINLVVALFRRGFDIETICLIMQQPLMHLLTHIYNKEAMLNPDKKNISVGRVINIALKQRFPKLEQRKECVKINQPLVITKKDLVSNLGKSLSSLGNSSQLARNQFDLLRALYSSFQYGFDLMNSNKLLKLDSTSSKHGNNSFEYMSRLFEVLSNPQANIFGFPNILDSDTKWKRLRESFNQQLILFNKLWENLDPKFEQFFVNYNASVLIPKMESWELEDLYNDWMLYQFTNDVHGTNPFTFATDNEVSSVGYFPTADSIYNYMLNVFPAQVLKKIATLQKTSQYQDNEFLKQLVSDIENNTSVLIVKTKDMGSVVRQKVQIGFHELFNDPQNQKFAMLLWMYNMYRNGLSTNKNAFWQLLPAEDVAKFQNYLQFLRTLNLFSTPEQTDEEFKAFEELYLRNNTNELPELDPYMYPDIKEPIFTEKIEIGVPYVNKDYRNKHLFNKEANRQTFEQMRKEFEGEFDASQILKQSTTENANPNVLNDEQVREFFKEHFKDAQKINPKLSTDINEQKDFLRIFAKYC